MNQSLKYRAEDFSVQIDAREYLSRFRDAERIAGYCRSCPDYGQSWGCPPFAEDIEERLRSYSKVVLLATRIIPQEKDLPLSCSRALILPERRRLEKMLLEKERETGGRACSYTGTCLYCPEGSCTRPQGKPCRHPDQVRPSLEACGFDVVKTVRELFGMELEWGHDGKMPRFLILVCGLFFNPSDTVSISSLPSPHRKQSH